MGGGMDAAELKLYGLVWKRFVASQMADAKTTVRTVSLAARKPALAHDYLFTASATEIDFEESFRLLCSVIRERLGLTPREEQA